MPRPDIRPPAALLGMIRLSLLLSVLLFVPLLVEQFETPKAIAIRVTGLAAFGVAAVAAGSPRVRRWTALDAAVGAWLAVEALATVFSVSPVLSLIGETEQRQGLLTSITIAALYCASRIVTRAAADAMTLLATAVGAVSVSCGYAVLQALGGDPLRWTRTSSAGTIAWRPFGTFGHPNLLGIVSGAALGASVALVATSNRRRGRWIAAALVCAAATVLTLSRGAWLGATAAALIAVGLAWRANPARRILRPALVGGCVLLGVGGIAVWLSGWGSLLAQRAMGLLSPGSGTGGTRIEIWRTAIAAFLARPWVGHGPDTFALVFPRFQTPAYWQLEWGGIPFHAHSLYFQALATRGVFGAAALAGLALAGILCARRAWRDDGLRPLIPPLASASAAIAVAGAFGDIGIGGWTILAVLAGSLSSLVSSRPPTEARGRGRTAVALPAGAHRQALAAGTLLALAASGWSAVELAASASDRRAQALLVQSGTEQASARPRYFEAAALSFARAARLSPLEDGIARRHALALLTLARVQQDPAATLSLAEAQARRAVRLEPLRSSNHLCLGTILLAKTHPNDPPSLAAMEAAFTRSLELGPQDGVTRIEFARAKLRTGHAAEALSLARLTADAYPRAGPPRLAIGEVLLALSDLRGAADALERSLSLDWYGDEASRAAALRLLAAVRKNPMAGGP